LTHQELKSRIQSGDVRALARAASMIENDPEAGRAFLKTLVSGSPESLAIGITGPPGAGKSTLAAALTEAFRKRGNRVAVLAVDPTSPFSRGALLGDRIRMQEHHGDSQVFIRSIATRGQLGGLAACVFDLVLLFEAASFDVILIETVGVGQDEIEISGTADTTIVVLVPGQGDDVQAIKAGIMEIADIFVINKADLPGAEHLEQHIRSMQSLAEAEQTAAPIRRVVATKREGVEDLVAELVRTAPGAKRTAHFWKARLRQLTAERMVAAIPERNMEAVAAELSSRQCDLYTAVERLLDAQQPAIDHLGIAVQSLDEALSFYGDQLGLHFGQTEEVADERVRVAMSPVGSGAHPPRVELLEPTDPTSTIARFLEKRGPGLHHVALRVPDLRASLERLRAAGARILNEPRAGAGGHIYVFVHPQSTGGVLLELIQQ
jgi:LAO/AO transport system kinase